MDSLQIQFRLPPAARSFHKFADFPTELRHQIWAEHLRVPGMHFLRLDVAAPENLAPPVHDGGASDDEDDDDDDDDDDDGDADSAGAKDPHISREAVPKVLFPATLQPLYPTKKADISYYVTLNMLMARLSVTCPDADRAVQHLLRRPDVLRLSTSGRVVSLDTAADVVCLDYLPAAKFESGCRMRHDLVCPDLDRVKRVAVRYCHKWDATDAWESTVCALCGRMHATSRRSLYPVHLYQMLARYLPRLETFYFIDYLILRKPEADAANSGQTPDQRDAEEEYTSHRQPAERPMPAMPSFKSGGRTYYEVDPKEWKIQSKVFDTLEWVQNSFIHHASASPVSRHKSPDKVEFKVLACEWDVIQPAPAAVMKQSGAAAPKKIQRNPKSSMKRPSGAADGDGRRRGRSPRPTKQEGGDEDDGLGGLELPSLAFRFGWSGNAFDFTFRQTVPPAGKDGFLSESGSEERNDD